VDVPNKEGRLLPGSFGEVHFAVGSNVDKVTVPVNAMLFRAEGPRLAVVGPDKNVELRAINIGKDYGTSLEILGGVGTGDRVIINPSDSLEPGQTVNVAEAPAENQSPQTPGAPKTTREGENAPERQQRSLQSSEKEKSR